MTKKKDDKLDEMETKYLRAMADLQNVRRRAQEERVELLRNGGEIVIQNILPVLDNLDRAAKSLPADLADNEWAKGMLSLEKSLFEALQKEGLELIDQTGVKLDPNLHEALMLDPQGKKGMVSEVLEKGYVLNGKVLRAAKVKVGG